MISIINGEGKRRLGMRRFKSIDQVQRFLDVHAAVYSLFNLGRHLVSAGCLSEPQEKYVLRMEQGG